MEHETLQYVDEFEAETDEARVGVVFVMELGLGRDVFGGQWFRIMTSKVDGTVCVASYPKGEAPTVEEIAAYERAMNHTARPLQQPARGVRVTAAGTMRLVK